MAISRISAVSAASNTVVAPSHQAGDLILVFAFRNDAKTYPTKPGDYDTATLIPGTDERPVSAIVGYKIATSSSESIGTWTDATGIVVHVYRGVGALGNIVPNSGTSGTMLYPSLDLYDTDGRSWAVRFAGHATATNLTDSDPDQAPNTPVTGVATAVRGLDSAGIIESIPETASQSVNNSSHWITCSLELMEFYTPQRVAGDTYFATRSGALKKLDAFGVVERLDTVPGGVIQMALDTSKALYYCLFYGNEVYKRDSGGVKTTILTLAAPEFLGGGVALDADDNIYISVANDDTNEGKIIKMTPLGDVSDFVTDLEKTPTGLAFDSLGNLFVVFYDSSEQRMLKIAPDGQTEIVTTYIGYGARGLSCDADDNLYAKTGSGVTQVTPAGIKSSSPDVTGFGAPAFDANGSMYGGRNNSIAKVGVMPVEYVSIGVGDVVSLLIDSVWLAPKVETLTEDFETGLNPAKWNIVHSGISDGRLVETEAEGHIYSVDNYALMDSALTVESSEGVIFGMSNDIDFTWLSIAFFCDGSVLSAVIDEDFFETQSYNAVDHHWLRITESAGVIRFETSPDGVTWSLFATATATASIFSATVGVAPYGGWVDNINIAPLPVMPKIETLTEDFNAPLDTGKWEYTNIELVGGRLMRGEDTVISGSLATHSSQLYSLVNSSLLFEASDPGEYPDDFTTFMLATADSSWVCWGGAGVLPTDANPEDFPPAFASLIGKSIIYFSDADFSAIVAAEFNGGWVRLDDSSGQLHLFTSSDGRTWLEAAGSLASTTDPISLTISLTTGWVDNINTPRTTVPVETKRMYRYRIWTGSSWVSVKPKISVGSTWVNARGSVFREIE